MSSSSAVKHAISWIGFLLLVGIVNVLTFPFFAYYAVKDRIRPAGM